MNLRVQSWYGRCCWLAVCLFAAAGALIAMPVGPAGLAQAQMAGGRVYLPLVGQPRVDDWSVLGQLGGPVVALAMDEQRAYVVVGTRIVAVDLEAGRSIGESMPQSAQPFELVARAGWLYALARDADDVPTLLVFDVRFSQQPHLSLTLPLSLTKDPRVSLFDLGSNLGIRFSDRIELWTLSPPASPRLSSLLPLPIQGTMGMVALGALVYRLRSERRDEEFGAVLDVIDLQEPERPRVVGQVDLPRMSDARLAVIGNKVVIGDGAQALLVDVGQSTDPRLLGTVQLPGEVDRLWAGNDRLYMAMHGLAAPADPEVPSLWSAEWKMESPLTWQLTFAQELVDAPLYDLAGSRLALVRTCQQGRHELEVIDLARQVPPKHIVISDVAALGNLVPADRHLLGILRGCPSAPARLVVADMDVTPWERPRIASQVNLPTEGPVGDFVYRAGFAYLPASEGLLIMDIRNPLRPRVHGLMPELTGRLFIDGQRLYVWGQTVRIFDISIPGELQDLGSVAPPDGQALAVSQGVLVSQDWDSQRDHFVLRLMNMSDPSHPRRDGGETPITDGVSFNNLSWYLSLAVMDGGVYAIMSCFNRCEGANPRSAVRVIDVRNPDQPQRLMAPAELGSGRDQRFLAAADGRLFVHSYGARLQVHDMQAPGKVSRSTMLRLNASEAAAGAGLAYVVTAEEGTPALWIFQAPSARVIR